MKSPFPGMDPFLEGTELWEDFHDVLLGVFHEQLAQLLPPGYVVRLKSRDYIQMVEHEGKRDHTFRPDVAVRTDKTRTRPRDGQRSAVATAATDPLELRAYITETHREKFIEIYQHGQGPRLITCIEVLSPSNKRAGSTGQMEYLRKRESLMLGDVHLVELDLLRGGQRMPMVDPWPPSPYVLMVARVDPEHRCQVWRGYSHVPLPSLPIPLLAPTPDVTLDVQSAVVTVYARGKYGESIDYARTVADLSPEETALVGPLKPRRQ